MRKQRTLVWLAALALLSFTAVPAMADMVTFGPAGAAPLQAVFDSRTLGPVAGVSSIDVDMDALSDLGDSYWVNTASGSVATMIVEQAGLATTNTFGIFDSADSSNSLEIFDGASASGGARTLFVAGDGRIWLDVVDGTPEAVFANISFGYYLDSSAGNGGGLWYSDTVLNDDGLDHMFAYQGQGDTFDMPDPWANGILGSSYYFLAWEDLDARYGGFDGDYTDMVVLIESVKPVPVPGAILLGVLGLGAAGLKLRRRNA